MQSPESKGRVGGGGKETGFSVRQRDKAPGQHPQAQGSDPDGLHFWLNDKVHMQASFGILSLSRGYVNCHSMVVRIRNDIWLGAAAAHGVVPSPQQPSCLLSEHLPCVPGPREQERERTKAIDMMF